MPDSPGVTTAIGLLNRETGESICWVVGCERCQRWTRVLLGVDGAKYLHHKPGCPHIGEWVPARRVLATEENESDGDFSA